MSKKPPLINEEERNAFREAMQGISTIRKQNRHTEKRPQPLRKQHQAEIDDEASYNLPYSLEHLPDERWVKSNETLQFSRGGPQHRLLSKLQRGQVTIEARLDLHRHTVDQAMHKTELFIYECHKQNIRFAAIVHGKGQYSPNGKPRIKNALNLLLQQHPLVLAFSSAQPRHGGTGAVYVLLKQK